MAFWNKNKKSTDSQQSTEIDPVKLIHDDYNASVKRQQEAEQHVVEMQGQFKQLDEGPGHKKRMEAEEYGKKFYRDILGGDKSKVDDTERKKYQNFVRICNEIKGIAPNLYEGNEQSANSMDTEEMYKKYCILAEREKISSPKYLLMPFEFEESLRRSKLPDFTLRRFIENNYGQEANKVGSIWEIYRATAIAEAIGLIDSYDKTFTSMYGPHMEDMIYNVVGFDLSLYPDKSNIDLTLSCSKYRLEQETSKVSGLIDKGIGRGIGKDEVQQAGRTIRTATMTHDQNRRDDSAK